MRDTRRARLQAVIQEELSTLIAREIKDPRVPSLTITSVEVAPDGSHATVYVSIFGTSLGTATGEAKDQASERAEREQIKACLEGLNSAAGYMRRQLAKVLTVRHIPTLAFRQDKGFENAIRVHEILKKISET